MNRTKICHLVFSVRLALFVGALLSANIIACGAVTSEDPSIPSGGTTKPPSTKAILGNHCDERECEAGLACVDITAGFQAPACFATCNVEGEACNAANDQTGFCEQIESGDLVCITRVGNMSGCGNRNNAACDEQSRCTSWLFAGTTVLTCTRRCKLDTPETCSDTRFRGCGCEGDEVCLNSTEDDSDGFCYPPRNSGERCGIQVNGDVLLCTHGGSCLIQSSPSNGVCQ